MRPRESVSRRFDAGGRGVRHAGAGIGPCGISFGFGGPAFGDPCDYYDYHDQPPPWGSPPGYCAYPVFFEPVFFGDIWYRGPNLLSLESRPPPFLAAWRLAYG
jgi:hypothetical protein